MTILQQPYIRSFADNPIIFLIEVATMSEIVRFRLDVNIVGITGTESAQWFEYYPYAENDKFYVKFDLSGILSQMAKKLYPLNTTLGITDNGWLRFYLTFFGNNENQIGNSNILFACPGGIPLELFQRLNAKNQNFFQHVLESEYSIIPLTVRNYRNNHFVIRQSELGDLVLFWHESYGVYPDLRINGKTISQLQAEGFIFNQISDTPQFIFLDLKELYEILDTDLIIFSNDENSFEVEILPEIISEEKYLLEFQNSLGFTEKYLVTGIAEIQNQNSDAEKYQDNATGTFITRYLRTKYIEKLNVSSGFRLKEELLVIQDILLSEEIYFIDLQKDIRRRCLITSDNFDLENIQTSPQEITLTVDFLTEESRFFGNINENLFENFLLTEDSEMLKTEDEQNILV